MSQPTHSSEQWEHMRWSATTAVIDWQEQFRDARRQSVSQVKTAQANAKEGKRCPKKYNQTIKVS